MKLRLRTSTLAEWTHVNPVLLRGEAGYESNTQFLRIGNGVDRFLDLPYLKDGGVPPLTYHPIPYLDASNSHFLADTGGFGDGPEIGLKIGQYGFWGNNGFNSATVALLGSYMNFNLDLTWLNVVWGGTLSLSFSDMNVMSGTVTLGELPINLNIYFDGMDGSAFTFNYSGAMDCTNVSISRGGLGGSDQLILNQVREIVSKLAVTDKTGGATGIITSYCGGTVQLDETDDAALIAQLAAHNWSLIYA